MGRVLEGLVGCFKGMFKYVEIIEITIMISIFYDLNIYDCS